MQVNKKIALQDGKVIQVKLSAAAWQVAEMFAEDYGQTLNQWCADVLADAEGAVNVAGYLRDRIMDEVLAKAVLASRAEAMPSEMLGLELASQCNDEDFKRTLALADIRSSIDFGSFTVNSGVDDCGHVAYFFKNHLSACSNLIVSIPITEDEWKGRVGE